MYQILARCDLQADSHKEVAAALGLSRRQFYRDRRAAFLALADAVEQPTAFPVAEVEVADALTMHLEYVQMLREQGRHALVWREATRALREMRGHPREVEVWTVASEAARFFGNVRQAAEAIEQMRRACVESPFPHLNRASALRIAICEIALESMLGRVSSALRGFESAVDQAGSEHGMYGRDATLFAILLENGAQLHVECGEWRSAEEFLRRAQLIIDRSELPYARARQQRLRGRIALERDGDVRRSLVEMRDALTLFQMHKVFAGIASAAVEYGIALANVDAGEGWTYVDHGLSVARDVCGYDEFAVLLASAATLMLDRVGMEATLRSIDEVRSRSPLCARADLYAGMAEAEVRLASGDFETVARQGLDLAKSFEAARLLPAAARATVITAESMAGRGMHMKARNLLKKSAELLREHAEKSVYERAKRFDTQLAL